jgi:hypothetical protein
LSNCCQPIVAGLLPYKRQNADLPWQQLLTNFFLLLLPANCCGIVAIQKSKCGFTKATIVDKLLLIIVVELLPAKCCEIVAIQKSKCFSKALYFFLVIVYQKFWPFSQN